jgi:hypothetical protein
VARGVLDWAVVPKFCRHGGVIERCPICRATIQSPAAPRARAPRAKPASRPRAPGTARTTASRSGVRVSREARAVDDGYRCLLVPGLRAEVEARELAREIAFACGRLALLAADPPGLYGEAASEPDLEEATWLVFLITHLSPLEGEDPFAGIRAARTSWHSGEPPRLEGGIDLGPRTSVDAARSSRTAEAYRRWARSAGSQQAAFTSDPGASPERRFERIFERLSLPGFGRQARYDLLSALGQLGIFSLRAPGLLLTEADATGIAAKRVFAIGDRMTLERRVGALVAATGVPVESLDLGLANWAGRSRVTLGAPPDTLDAEAEAAVLGALEL